MLYTYGGVYLDADFECLEPFDQLNTDLMHSILECYAGIEAELKQSGQFSEFTHGLIASGTMPHYHGLYTSHMYNDCYDHWIVLHGSRRSPTDICGAISFLENDRSSSLANRGFAILHFLP
jgi:Glycosyltransferase sugar-binding region containing DXD motif